MQETSRDRLAVVVGWLILAVPSVAVLLFAAWISSYKLGVNGGIAYAVALAIWVALLVWRARSV